MGLGLESSATLATGLGPCSAMSLSSSTACACLEGQTWRSRRLWAGLSSESKWRGLSSRAQAGQPRASRRASGAAGEGPHNFFDYAASQPVELQVLECAQRAEEALQQGISAPATVCIQPATVCIQSATMTEPATMCTEHVTVCTEPVTVCTEPATVCTEPVVACTCTYGLRRTAAAWTRPARGWRGARRASPRAA